MKTKSGAVWSGIWKRNAVVAAIALFVCAAVYLNWNYEQEVSAGKTLGEATMVDGAGDPLVGQETANVNPEDGQADSKSYFANARLNRQQARDSALTMLQGGVEGEEADPAMQEQNAQAIQTMADYTVTEAQIENLVIAKGYADCVAFIGEQSLSLAVAAPAEGLTDLDTARILDVVGQVSDFGADQTKIIAVE